MNFLLPNLKERPQKSNIDLPSDDAVNEESESFEDEVSESSVGTQNAFDDMVILSPHSERISSPRSATPLTPSSSQKSTVSKPKRPPKPELKSAEVLQKFLENKEKRKNADHLTKFFESAEETTRSLPPELQIEIKHRISMLLYEFELEAIKKSTSNADVVNNTDHFETIHSNNSYTIL